MIKCHLGIQFRYLVLAFLQDFCLAAGFGLVKALAASVRSNSWLQHLSYHLINDPPQTSSNAAWFAIFRAGRGQSSLWLPNQDVLMNDQGSRRSKATFASEKLSCVPGCLAPLRQTSKPEKEPWLCRAAYMEHYRRMRKCSLVMPDGPADDPRPAPCRQATKLSKCAGGAKCQGLRHKGRKLPEMNMMLSRCGI